MTFYSANFSLKSLWCSKKRVGEERRDVESHHPFRKVQGLHERISKTSSSFNRLYDIRTKVPILSFDFSFQVKIFCFNN